MGIERVEMILPLFYVYAQANNVQTDRSTPRFMYIVYKETLPLYFDQQWLLNMKTT